MFLIIESNMYCFRELFVRARTPPIVLASTPLAFASTPPIGCMAKTRMKTMKAMKTKKAVKAVKTMKAVKASKKKEPASVSVYEMLKATLAMKTMKAMKASPSVYEMLKNRAQDEEQKEWAMWYYCRSQQGKRGGRPGKRAK